MKINYKKLYDLGASVTVLDFDKKNFNQLLKKNMVIKKKKN